MKGHVDRCSGINIRLSKTLYINVYTSSWSKQKHNELKSTSSPDAQSSFSITENESDRNVGKKAKGTV